MTDNIFVDLSSLWKEIERYTTKWEDAGFTFPDAERCVAFIIEETGEAYSDFWRKQDADKYLRNNDPVVDVDEEVADTLRMALTLLMILGSPIDNFIANSGSGTSERDAIELIVISASEVLQYFRSYKHGEQDTFQKAMIISTRRIIQFCLRWFNLRGEEPETIMLAKMRQTDNQIQIEYGENFDKNC